MNRRDRHTPAKSTWWHSCESGTALLCQVCPLSLSLVWLYSPLSTRKAHRTSDRARLTPGRPPYNRHRYAAVDAHNIAQ